MLRQSIIIVVLALLLASCAQKQEPLYQGLTLKAWGERLKSDEPETRTDALKVIAGIGEAARPMEQQLRDVARHDPYEDIRYLAVVALDSMRVPVTEFLALQDKYQEPEVAPEEEQETVEEDTAMATLEEHASTDDDISYLKQMAEGTVEGSEVDSSVMPLDSLQREEWISKQQDASLQNLHDQLRDPRTLAKLLITGDLYERRFAARVLAEMGGEDSDVVSALQSGTLDADSLVRAAVKEARSHWQLP
jgi:hypothetical protein